MLSSKNYTFAGNKHVKEMRLAILIGMLAFTLLFAWVAYLILETGKWKYLIILFTPFFLIAWYIGYLSNYFEFYYDYYHHRTENPCHVDSFYNSVFELTRHPAIDSVIQANSEDSVIKEFKRQHTLYIRSGWYPPFAGDAPCEHYE